MGVVGKKKQSRDVCVKSGLWMCSGHSCPLECLLEWDNTSLRIHLSPACALALHTQLVMTSKGTSQLEWQSRGHPRMPPAEHELGQDGFTWQPPGEGAQLSALVPPLFSASAHENQHHCPSSPWHKNLWPNLVPGTLGSKSSRHYQNPALWVHSHHLGGKGRDPCSSNNIHSQLPGHLPWFSLQKEDTVLLLFLVFCALFLFHWCFMLSYRRISPEKLLCIRISVFIYDLKGKHLLLLLSCHLSSAFLVAVALLVVSSFFLYPHYLSALYLPVSVTGHMLVSVFSGTK